MILNYVNGFSTSISWSLQVIDNNPATQESCPCFPVHMVSIPDYVLICTQQS